MRNIDSITVRQHVKLISGVSQVLNPLNLVVAVVDEPFVEERKLVPSSRHYVGFKNTLLETSQASILHGLC